MRDRPVVGEADLRLCGEHLRLLAALLRRRDAAPLTRELRSEERREELGVGLLLLLKRRDLLFRGLDALASRAHEVGAVRRRAAFRRDLERHDCVAGLALIAS